MASSCKFRVESLVHAFRGVVMLTEISMTNARILKAYSHSHSTSGASVSVSATQHSMIIHSLSMSGKLHLHSDHSQTALEIEVEFEWSLSVGYTSLEPHSHELVINNIANVWLERLELLDNLPRNNRNEKKKKFQLRNV